MASLAGAVCGATVSVFAWGAPQAAKTQREVTAPRMKNLGLQEIKDPPSAESIILDN